MKRILTLIVFIAATALAVNAQNIYHTWILGVSTNYTDFHVIDQKLGDQFSNAVWMGKQLPTMLRVGRMVNSSFVLTGVLSTVTLDAEKLNEIPLQKNVTSDFFWKVGGQIEYKFANGYLLNETSWFDPYLFVGFSGSTIDETTYASFPMGVGFNVWPLKYLGLNFQGSYDYVFDFNDYMNYSAGLVIRFGDMADKDKDLIPNKIDACPDIFGVAEFQGCPDYDGDGVTDSLDLCPKTYGIASANGCPDFDKDGIPDAKDECPCEAGLEENNGCPDTDDDDVLDKVNNFPNQPDTNDDDVLNEVNNYPDLPDTDGDGVLDKVDNCPDQPGSAATYGCPDADGDGIPDEYDNCPKEPGLKSNDGCPETKQPDIIPIPLPNSIEIHEKNIVFGSNSSVIHKSSTKSLDAILKIIKQNPNTKYTIHGHTDNTGPEDYNEYLSRARANAVKKYFTNRGIANNRLEAKGFGSKSPVATNNTPEGRAENRRVEINEK